MKGRIGAVVFFGLLMLTGGALTYFVFGRPTIQVIDARHWTETSCRIVDSMVLVSRHSTPHGGGGLSSDLKLFYTYKIAGSTHGSNRYDFLGIAFTTVNWKEAIAHRYPQRSTAVCYVNPRDPTEVVLERGFTVVYLYALIPLAVFFLGLVGVFISIKNWGMPAPAALGGTFGLERADWAAGRIRSSNRPAMWGAWFIALLWNAIVMPAAFVLLGDAMKEGNPAVLIGLILPAVGVGLLVWAVRATIRWRKFGESVFEMDSGPGVIGGALTGKICLTRSLRPEGGFKLKLSCINRVVTSAGKNDSVQETFLWQDEQEVSDGGGAIPVAFYIPPDCRESDSVNQDDRILWRLEATARVPGIDYAAQFEVPVFKTARTHADAAVVRRVQEVKREAVAHYQPPSASRIRVQPAPTGGTEFYFASCRILGAAVIVTALFLILSRVIWLQLRTPKFPISVSILTGLFDLLVFYAMLNLWFGSRRTIASTDAISIRGGIFGGLKTRTIPAADIERIAISANLTLGSKVYRKIRLILKDGSEITAGSGIADVREAEWLAAEMSRCVGLGSS